MKLTSFTLLFVMVCIPSSLKAMITPTERHKIDTELGITGTYVQTEDTYKFSFLGIAAKLMVHGREVGQLGSVESSAAFIGDPHHGGCLLVAELALLEDEVNPVLSTALDNGLTITSLGNDYLFEQPRILFMEVSGLGEPTDLAKKLSQVREIIGAIRVAHSSRRNELRSRTVPRQNHLNASDLDSILMTQGRVVHGVYQASMGMAGTIFGVPAGKQMGLRTWVMFAGTDENAIVKGQIIMTANQVRNVLRALRKGGIYVTALHNHFIDSNPDFYFVHFWGKGPARDLALTVRNAMETQMR